MIIVIAEAFTVMIALPITLYILFKEDDFDE